MVTIQSLNDCKTCQYMKIQMNLKDGAHCYMFKEEPNCKCAQHRPVQQVSYKSSAILWRANAN